MDVVKNQMSIPTYEKPMMEVMELEVEGALLQGSVNVQMPPTTGSEYGGGMDWN